MNSLTVSNVALLTLGIGSLSAAVEMAKTNNYIGGVIAVAVGLILLVGYEKLPPSTQA